MSKLPTSANPQQPVPREIALAGFPVLWFDPTDDIPVATLSEAFADAEKNLANATPHPERRREFIAGRWLARTLCDRLRQPIPADGIGRGPNGEPVWPSGTHGSITHKDGLIAATATTDITAVGLDIERVDRVSEGVARRVSTTNDIALGETLIKQGVLDTPLWNSLLFSSKEAVFKCLFPLHQRMFWFDDAWLVRVDPATNSFDIATRPEFSMGHESLRGSFTTLTDGKGRRLVMTLVAAPRA